MTKASVTGEFWVEGELRLSGIDKRMVALLKAIADTGSISQAAKQCGLSYKGAWQIIERANNTAPNVLISTATGGTKGGGAALTETGRALLDLFTGLEAQHRQFLAQLNHTLLNNPEARLLLQRLAVKTSVRNQLFGTVKSIQRGAVNAKVVVNLAGDIPVEVDPGLSALNNLDLKTGADAVLLINGADIIVTRESDHSLYSAANRLPGRIIRIQWGDINTEVSVLLPNGETLAGLVTKESAEKMPLVNGADVKVMFNANAPILGLKQTG